MMSNPDLLYRIAITMLQDIGSITAKKLIAYAGSAKAVFSEKYSNLIKIPGIGSHLAKRISTSQVMQEAEKELLFIEKKAIEPLYFLDDNYPDRLKHCIDGPLLLYLKGEHCLSNLKLLSVVGTRRASSYGKEVCREIINDLAGRHPDIVIISGLAYGIDIMAHKAALSANLKTAAVLGHGFRTLYPSEHRNYAKRIIEHGCLITDFNSTVNPERNNFIRRNRIIAGLSDATLVVESGRKGGALITADIAGSYSREILAVPGRPTDEYARGCNDMIKRNMAALVESAEDIECVMNWDSGDHGHPHPQVEMVSFSPEEQKIIKAIHVNPDLQPEAISNQTSIPIHKVISLLIEMELRGWLTPLPGNLYRLKVTPL